MATNKTRFARRFLVEQSLVYPGQIARAAQLRASYIA